METTVLQEESFIQSMNQHGINTKRNQIELLQLNITKKCNQSCIHCHVNAGPARKEEMSLRTIDRILELLQRKHEIKTVDITGGAPELHTSFQYLVKSLRQLDLEIIDRCNLSVLLEAGQEDTAQFLAENQVSVIASLPCYTAENVNYQRGDETYQKSILALKKLNALGYGIEGSKLILNLVYNPLGDYLPGDQSELEADYKLSLAQEHGITFHHLYTITNMPINRYAGMLKREGKYTDYRKLLYSSFNGKAAEKIMCKKQVSLGPDGTIYDCDFNQALNLPICSGKNSIWDISNFTEISEHISYHSHCYGCTAGTGSSCQGKLE